MAIIFGSDAGVREDHFGNYVAQITQDLSNISSGILDNFSRLTGQPIGLGKPPPKESVFVDSGFTNVPGTSFLGTGIDNIDDIQTRRHTTQEPILTVYVKKRQFWSLRNEYDPRFMDDSERLFMRATKLLFERKCNQVAAYEALTKASSLISEEVELDSNRINQLIDILRSINFDALNADLEASVATDPNNTAFLLDIVQVFEEEMKKYNDILENLEDLAKTNEKLRHATNTTWVVDTDDTDAINTGRGAGVIELTTITDLRSSLSLDGGLGSISFSVQDPYNIMKITSDDIDAAITFAYSEDIALKQMLQEGISPEALSGQVNRGPVQILEEARRKEEELRRHRKERIANSFGLGAGSAGPLNNADFPEIVFEINPTSYSSNKVTATITNLPETFNKDNFRIVLLQLPILEQLDITEDRLVVEIFELLDEYVTTVQAMNERNKAVNTQDSVKYARRQLRKFYLGKSIVQPMDGIHVYIRSKTIKDGEGVGPLDALLSGTNFVQQFATDRDISDDMIEEEMRQFGIDKIGISVDLYKLLRTSSFLRNAGVHTFGGLISNVTENYNANSGSYTLNISGQSNMKWLAMSRINVRPSLDQAEGILEDPLTPYTFKIQEGTGLIEGKELLQANKQRISDGLLHFDDSSSRKGQKVTEQNLVQDYSDNGDGTAQEIQQHAPGMIYRWKEGIISVTRDVNLKRPLDGSDDQSNKLARDYGITVTTGSNESGPFASLDAADIVSLLVTGVPHNYESFFENAKSVGVYTPGQNNSAESYFHSFFDIQKSTRKALGNFQPYKVINVNQKSLHKRVNIQGFLTQDSKEIRNLRSELARLQDQLDTIGGARFKDAADPNRARAENALKDAIAIVQQRLDQKQAEFKQHAKEGEALGLRIYGNDPTATTVAAETAESESEARKESDRSVRLRNTLIQMRPQIRCKFNNDENLFIVGDEYDKDLDIQAFVLQSLNSQEPPLWESGFKTPIEICQNVAKTLDFEFFCDTQGHIHFRPPRYNKTPLSLLLKLFMLDEREGKQLYPDFLRSLFNLKSKTLKEQLENIDTEIAVNITKLGGNFDQINRITEERITDDNSSPGAFELQPIKSSAATTSGSVENAVKTVVEFMNILRSRNGGESIQENSAEEQEIRDEIEELNSPGSANVNSKRLALTDKTSQLVSRRQQLAATLSKVSEQEDKFSGRDGTSRFSTNMSKSEREEALEPFRDIIEDDFNDFLGPGSSKRFIIYDDQIISSNFVESDENVEYTRIDVAGEIDLLGDKPGNIGQVPVLWAGATDFDLWRQYGWRTMGSVNKPFFKDAESQCAPYALMLLTRQRRNVVRGTITIYGNEFYQLGDVVYVNSRDMLYYVTRVDQSFDYGSGSFQTTLELKYGHPLGEYIPTPLDVMGKALIKTQKEFNKTKTIRQTVPSAKPVVHLGLAIFGDQEGDSAMIDMLHGQYALHNVTQLKNALLKAVAHIGPDTADGFPKVEIRGYYTDSTQANKIKRRMEAMRTWFKSPRGRYIETKQEFIKLDKDSFDDQALTERQIRAISSNNDPIDVINPNEHNIAESRYPRDEVFSAASIVGLNNIIEAVLVQE